MTAPTTWNRIAALLHGEISAATLEAYRRASLPVLELLDQTEGERLSALAEGKNAWTVSPAQQAEVRPVTLDGTKLTPGEQFVFDVTAEGMNLGYPFRKPRLCARPITRP